MITCCQRLSYSTHKKLTVPAATLNCLPPADAHCTYTGSGHHLDCNGFGRELRGKQSAGLLVSQPLHKQRQGNHPLVSTWAALRLHRRSQGRKEQWKGGSGAAASYSYTCDVQGSQGQQRPMPLWVHHAKMPLRHRQVNALVLGTYTLDLWFHRQPRPVPTEPEPQCHHTWVSLENFPLEYANVEYPCWNMPI